MTDAYKCDKCGEYREGQPAFRGKKTLVGVGESGEYDFCAECWAKIRVFVENPEPPEDRLTKEHHNAPKDENDDPVGITEGADE